MPAIGDGALAARRVRLAAGLPLAAAEPPSDTRRLAIAPEATLSGELERARLELRASQLARVLAILERRRQAVDADRAEHSGLQRAIGDFAGELEQVRARLSRIGGVPG